MFITIGTEEVNTDENNGKSKTHINSVIDKMLIEIPDLKNLLEHYEQIDEYKDTASGIVSMFGKFDLGTISIEKHFAPILEQANGYMYQEGVS